MSFLVKCDRCGITADVVFNNIDTGYWTQPSDWQTIIGGNQKLKQIHLCPPCGKQALH